MEGEPTKEGEQASSTMEGEPTRIMVAVNQSAVKGYPHPSISCRRAFEWTLQKIVRTNTSGFKLLFIHVLVPGEHDLEDIDKRYATPEDLKDLEKKDRAKGLNLLEFFIDRCREIGVASEAWLKRGDPTEVICNEVKRVQPDFLVMGTRGLGPFQRVFVGTVSEFCVKHAECPVITIKRTPDEIPDNPAED